MYHRYYGLSRPPFAATPDPTLLYMGKIHREALATIIYGVETRKGLIVCTGEVGTGKTAVARAFCSRVPTARYKIINVLLPQIAPKQLLRCICRELGVEPLRDSNATIQRLRATLIELLGTGQTAVLLVDEAQHLSGSTLEFLRLLSNLETNLGKLLQIILVGQPEFEEMLARHDMRQVNQRIALRPRLYPLDPEESLKYIHHRLGATGAPRTDEVLSTGAAAAIVKAAQGIPRLINILADNVLICGFGLDEKPVTARTADRVVNAFGANDNPAHRRRSPSQQTVGPAADPPAFSRGGLGWNAWIGVAAAIGALAVLAYHSPLSLEPVRHSVGRLLAQTEHPLQAHNEGSLAAPAVDTITTSGEQGQPVLPLDADQPASQAVTSTAELSNAPSPAAQMQDSSPTPEVNPVSLTSPTPKPTDLMANDIAALLAHGDQLFERKDFTSALLYYERAAEAINARRAQQE
jgi:type II secretory pathway predicted ATPase ExeA